MGPEHPSSREGTSGLGEDKIERGREREIIGNNCVYFSILLKAGLQVEMINGVDLSVLLKLFFVLPQTYRLRILWNGAGNKAVDITSGY